MKYYDDIYNHEEEYMFFFSFGFLEGWNVSEQEKTMYAQKILDFCQELLDGEYRWQAMNILGEGYINQTEDYNFLPKNPELALQYGEEMLAVAKDYYPAQIIVKKAKKELGLSEVIEK